MTPSATLSLPVVQPERCCQPGQCAYTPSRVRGILSFIRHMRADGHDPGEAAASARGSDGEGGVGGAAGGSGLVHKARGVWDVQHAQAALGGRPSAAAFADWLCPVSSEDNAPS